MDWAGFPGTSLPGPSVARQFLILSLQCAQLVIAKLRWVFSLQVSKQRLRFQFRVRLDLLANVLPDLVEWIDSGSPGPCGSACRVLIAA
jgi:hypothetical protein